MLYDARGEFSQRPRKDICHDHVKLSVDVRRRGRHGQSFLHAVLCGVAARRQNRLRIDIHCVRVLASELEGGDRQQAGTAAIIEQRASVQIERIQPFQAHCGRCVRAGAEGESRVESDDDCIRLVGAAPGRADPQPVAKAHRAEVFEPFALPLAVGQRFQVMLGQFLESE